MIVLLWCFEKSVVSAYTNMTLKKIISDYTRYNHWANKKMTRWLKSLDKDLLYKETPSSFSSIDLTLQHINHAQNFWLTVLTEGDTTKLDETIKFNAVDVVITDLLAGSQQMLDSYEAYTEDELLKKVSNGVTIQCRYDFILHAINHNSYHRGQIVTMSRRLGVINNIPNTDYEAFLWAGD